MAAPKRRKAAARAAERTLSWSDMDLIRRHDSILPRATTLVCVLNMQERLMPDMAGRFDVTARTVLFLRAAALLGLPVLVTEHCPDRLGPTDPRLAPLLETARKVSKTAFSAVGAPAFVDELALLKPTHVVLAGVEAHVDVAQTGLDLLARALHVTVLSDAVTSRFVPDRANALARLAAAGATIGSVESAIFELMESADTPAFQEILPLLRG